MFILSAFLAPLFFLALVGTIIYLILRRVDEAEQEDFDKRDN